MIATNRDASREPLAPMDRAPFSLETWREVYPSSPDQKLLCRAGIRALERVGGNTVPFIWRGATYYVTRTNARHLIETEDGQPVACMWRMMCEEAPGAQQPDAPFAERENPLPIRKLRGPGRPRRPVARL